MGERSDSVVKAVQDVVVPKKEDGKISWTKLTGAWGRMIWVVTVIGTFITAYNWVNDKLETIEQNAVDMQEMKTANNGILQEQRQLSQRITNAVQEGNNRITQAFEQRDEVDRHQEARITAVLNEVRARHGVVPLADGETRRVQIRRIEEEERRARASTGNAPEPPTLEGLGL